MKISGPTGVRPAAGARRTAKPGGGFSVDMNDAAPEEKSSIAGAGPIASIDALVALQGDQTRHGAKAVIKDAEDILDLLEDVRRGLLMGSIPPAKLSNLVAATERRRAAVEDPRLAAILDEIDLRARVEIAKHAQTMRA